MKILQFRPCLAKQAVVTGTLQTQREESLYNRALKIASGNLLALQKFVALYLAWFNKLVLIYGTDLGTTFEKLIMDRLNQKLEDNKQGVIEKAKVAT